jgi:hypothetical protein
VERYKQKLTGSENNSAKMQDLSQKKEVLWVKVKGILSLASPGLLERGARGDSAAHAAHLVGNFAIFLN